LRSHLGYFHENLGTASDKKEVDNIPELWTPDNGGKSKKSDEPET